MTNLSEIAGRFQVVRKLGSGGSGDVYLCLDSDGTQTAVKLFTLDGLPPGETLRLGKQKNREAKSVANKLAGTRLLDLIDAGFDHSLEIHYIATALVPGIPLSEWVREHGAPSVEQAVAWALDITGQLSVVHDLGVAHFDVKPANIIIRGDDGSAQLIDFGEALARNWTRSERHRTGIRGTFGYMAPEIHSGQQIGWNPGADVFGFGAVFYEMLTGVKAFSDRPGFSSVVKGIPEGQPSLDAWHYPPEIPSRSVPDTLRNLCRKCLDPDSRERPRAVDVHTHLVAWTKTQRESEELPSRETLPVVRSDHRMLVMVSASIAIGLTMLLIGASFDREPEDVSGPADAPAISAGRDESELAVSGRPSPALPVLATVRPRRFESFDGGILGFELTDADVVDESQPLLRLSDVPELQGTIYLSRLLYFRSFLLPSETKLIKRRAGTILTQVAKSVDANVWATPLVSDAVPVNVESRSGGVVAVRPVAPLTDGVYCLHSGPLLADLPPKVTVPFIVRGFGVPVPTGSQLTTDGSQLTFRVRLRNEGTGDFNRWFARMWLNQAESGRLIRAHSRDLEAVSIAAGADYELIGIWTGGEMTAGKYHVSCKVGNRDFNSPGTTWFDAVTAPPFQIDEDGTVRILSEPRRLNASQTLTGHSDRVWSLAFHPDGKRLFSSSEDRTVRCWNVDSGQEIDRFTQHAENLLTLAVSENGRTVLSAGFDRSAWLWTLQDHLVFQHFAGHHGKIWQAVFRPGHQQVITASEDGTLRLWSTMTGDELARWPNQSNPRHGAMLSVSVDPQGEFCIAGSSDGLLVRWDLNTMRSVSRQGEGWIRGIAISPDSRHVAVGYGKELHRLNSDTLTSAEVLSSPETTIFGVAVTSDGRRVISGTGDGRVLVSPLTATLVASIFCDGHEDEVLSVAVSRDGRQAAAGAADGTIRIWNLPSAQ